MRYRAISRATTASVTSNLQPDCYAGSKTPSPPAEPSRADARNPWGDPSMFCAAKEIGLLGGSDWRPGPLDRARAFGRRAMISTLGEGVEDRIRGAYHDVLRRADRFGPPESEATVAVLAAIAARSQTIFDIGANVGRYTWFLGRHASERSFLFAFEPHPKAAGLLRRTVGVSPRWAVLEIAVADRDESAQLVVPDGPFGAPISALAWVRTQGGRGDRDTLRISMRRIDSLIEDGVIHVAGPAFMKIDVEGAEARVLRGAAGFLTRHRPVIYFECETRSATRQGETPEGLWGELKMASYQIFMNRANSFVPVDRIQPEAVNYLAIPDSDTVAAEHPLDIPAMIAVVDRWARRQSRA